MEHGHSRRLELRNDPPEARKQEDTADTMPCLKRRQGSRPYTQRPRDTYEDLVDVLPDVRDDLGAVAPC